MTLALVLWLGTAAAAQTAPAPGAIRGVIVDARDGTPLEKVSVRIQETRPLSKLKRWRLVEVIAH